jgi:hypothetical protein
LQPADRLKEVEEMDNLKSAAIKSKSKLRILKKNEKNK